MEWTQSKQVKPYFGENKIEKTAFHDSFLKGREAVLIFYPFYL